MISCMKTWKKINISTIMNATENTNPTKSITPMLIKVQNKMTPTRHHINMTWIPSSIPSRTHLKPLYINQENPRIQSEGLCINLAKISIKLTRPQSAME